MEIPLNAPVECTDGVCGSSKYVLVNPVKEEVTHVVVKETSSKTEYIVPLELISQTVAGTIQIRCSKKELEQKDQFVQTSFVPEKVLHYGNNPGYGKGTFFYFPYVQPDKTTEYHTMEEKQVPPGEVAMFRGTKVEASDGYIGRVDEFVVDPKNCNITHLVMREGHFLKRRDVIIPLSAIGHSHDDSVFLKLNKKQVEALPTFPVKRRWL